MRSNGGVASVAEAAERPVTLMLSGPAAGVLGAQWAGRLVGRGRLITFDMGGTSTDIGLVTEAGINEASARDTHIADYPLLVPMFDIETIGAGGGSIAHVDAAGAFKVGPRSAGAVPGPAAYGQGGDGADDHRRARRARAHRPGPLPGRRDGARHRRRRGRDRRAGDRARDGAAGGRGGHPHRRQRQHGADDPLDHRRARPRPARVRARGLRRRRTAARRRRRRPCSACPRCWCRRTRGSRPRPAC